MFDFLPHFFIASSGRSLSVLPSETTDCSIELKRLAKYHWPRAGTPPGPGRSSAREIGQYQEVANLVGQPCRIRRRQFGAGVTSSSSLSSTAAASGQSKPTRAARAVSLAARVREGGRPARRKRPGRHGRRVRRFCASQEAVCSAAPRAAASPNTCGWRRIILSAIARADLGEVEAAGFLGHPRVIRLEQEIAKLVAKSDRAMASATS